jgi:hypothetical protein
VLAIHRIAPLAAVLSRARWRKQQDCDGAEESDVAHWSIHAEHHAARLDDCIGRLSDGRLAELVASVCNWLEPLLDPRGASEPEAARAQKSIETVSQTERCNITGGEPAAALAHRT